MDDSYQTPLHMDLKRDVDTHPFAAVNATAPLFEKYQFLNPGK